MHEGVLSLVKATNYDKGESKILGITHLEVVGLYTVNTQKLPILIKVGSEFMKASYTSFFFRARIFHQCKNVSGSAKVCALRPPYRL